MFDLVKIIETAGYIGLFGIVFAESGLLVGFFLPGDSLLFTAGVLASQGVLNIWMLIPILFIAAVTGDSFGYAFGKRVGPKIFKRPDSLLFHHNNVVRAQSFFQKHGGKTIILARFMPVVRTFAPILAGVGGMSYRKFLAYNLGGGALWTFSVTLTGYYLGKAVPNVDKYLIPTILGIIILSIAPSVWHVLRTQEDRARVLASLKRLFHLQ